MAIEIKVPSVGESITEVTLVKWLKKDGEWVERDEVVAELESEKATFEINAEQAGILKTVALEGDSLKISISNTNLGDTIKWYNGNSMEVSNSKIIKESLSLYAIRTDSLGCQISSDTISVIKNKIPEIPKVADTIFCQNTNQSVLSATAISEHALSWYGTNASGGTGNASAVVAPTNDTTTKSYYVSQINNTTSCESPRVKITVKINPAPATPSVKDTAYCNNISADTLKASSLTGHSLN
jgi:hypothetical protein